MGEMTGRDITVTDETEIKRGKRRTWTETLLRDRDV